MKRSRLILVGALALGLAGSVAAAAQASGTDPGPTYRTQPYATTSCPPPGAAGADRIQVKDGKVYHNGKLVATVPPGEANIVASKDGKVYVGKDAEALGIPSDASGHVTRDGSGPGRASDAEGHVRVQGLGSGAGDGHHAVAAEGGSGPVTECAVE
ncbi:hypothetical protein JOL79_25680 [Microbispora sp. RL4-1S]|uniref:Uncharacterized protein n=1 Tax=Microbispora oryzae TaxID=2806554 RepID=A0A940WK80_9ACTN|nr:hypothetical protein [Microbispora oryzae]MBP2707180.1 hypothetical protein [Microbispora oryzae]